MKLASTLWTFLGCAATVVVALVALRLHDAQVRADSQFHAAVAAADDTIAQLRTHIDSLAREEAKTDTVYADAKTGAIQIAVIPRALRDSIAHLNDSLTAARARGDVAIPIATGIAFSVQLAACTAKVDSIADQAIPALTSACEQRVAQRDGIIADHEATERQQDKKIALLTKRSTGPRLVPFVAADYGIPGRRWGAEGGAMLRLFSGLHATASLERRDSTRVRLGGRWEFR